MPCDYEHIVPYNQAPEHTVDNITLLCTKHHRDVNAGRVSKRIVKAAQLNPFAAKLGSVSKYSFLLSESEYPIKIGSNTYYIYPSQILSLLTVNGKDYFSLRFKHCIPLFSLRIENADGGVALELIDNTFSVSSQYVSDVKLTGKRFTVKDRIGSYIIDVQLENSVITFNKVKIIAAGCALSVNKLVDKFMIGQEHLTLAISNSEVGPFDRNKICLVKIGVEPNAAAVFGSGGINLPASYEELRRFLNKT